MFSGTAQVFLVFFVNSVCLLVLMTVVDKNKALVCCLLATSAILLSELKRRKESVKCGVRSGI
jgi:hypothetical protein